MTSTVPRWLLCRRRRPEAAYRLYCFPHSGASVGEYVRWSDYLPGVEVIGVQPPGRGHRIAEPSFDRMQDLVDALLRDVEFTGPFAFFGHSLGSLTAYEVARALHDAGRPGPEVLFVSALGAPHFQPTHPSLSSLDDQALIRAVAAEFGDFPPELDEDSELREMVVSSLRADYAILDSYRAAPAPPLTCRIIALGGSEDEGTALLPGWADYTTSLFSTHVMSGGHFYLREHHDQVNRIILDGLAASAPR